MTPLSIIPKGKGPISRAIRELDERTRALTPGDSPGMRISRSSRGVTLIPTAQGGAGTKTPPMTPVWG